MAEEAVLKTFHWADYLVVVIFLLFSSLLGVVIGWRDRRQATTKNFLLGGGDMHYIPVALSMQASFLSAIFILTTPTEIYNFGTMYSLLAISYFIAMPITAHIYLPTFHKLRLTSAYEYLERRFNRTVRIAGALTFALMVILYIAVVLYTPAIALAQVTGMSVVISITVCGVVCVIYTVLGGMKATIWNDFIQMIVILVGLIVLITIGIVKVGGNIWDINEQGNRIDFVNFNPDPTVRLSFWTQTVGGTFLNLTLYASSQTIIQKFLSVRELRNAQKAVWTAAFTSAIFLLLVCVLGLVMYAYYAHCDPILAGRIKKPDQMVPLFVMDVMGDLHGLPGLFLAATFSAALSSISGSLNALSAVFLVDFIRPVYKKVKGCEITERLGNIISRSIALGFGILTIVMGFAAQYFGDLVLQIALSIFGFVGGPLTALVSLGLFFPFINSWGALAGLVTSLGISSWIAIGKIVEKPPVNLLIKQSDGCAVANVTLNYTLTSVSELSSATAAGFLFSTAAQTEQESVLWVYQLSFMWYALIAMVVAIVVAIPVSLVTGIAKDTDERLTYQWSDNCCCYCPAPYKHCLRCGAKHYEHDSDARADDVNSTVDQPWQPEVSVKSETTAAVNWGFDDSSDVVGSQIVDDAKSDTHSTGLDENDGVTSRRDLPPVDYEITF